MLEKITNLLRSGTANNIELAYHLSMSTQTSLWPVERAVKNLLFISHTQPKIFFDPIPLPQLVYALNEIIALSIYNQPIEYIPEELFFFRNVAILEIQNTALKELPKSFSSLKQLKHLTINNTEISSLPNDLNQLNNLKQISLINNPNLHQLPDALLQLPNLKKLRISPSIKLTAQQQNGPFQISIIEKTP